MIWPTERREGFALPAVLTVTGVVTLVFVVAITALASLTAEARSARSRVAFMQRALTLEATLSYLMVTEPFTARAIAVGSPRNYDAQFVAAEGQGVASAARQAEIQLDGQLYVTDSASPMTVSLRDQAGMLNLQQMDATQLRRLSERLGIDRLAQDWFPQRFQDYVDTDDLENIGGAERAAYAGVGPANRPLMRPSELLSVSGVRDAISAARWRALRPDIAVDARQGVTNINTASPLVLEVLFDLTPEQAQRAIDTRHSGPLFGLTDLGAATGAPLVDDGATLYTFPSGKIVFTLSDGRSPWVYRGRLSITPADAEQPIWLDQTDVMESPQRTAADSTNAIPFPYAAR